MDFQGTQQFAAAPDKVWDTLMDANVLKESIPGAQNVAINGSTIDVTLNLNVPVPGLSGERTISADITQQTRPSHAVLSLDRAGGAGSIKGTVTIDLAPNGSGTTLTYNAHIELGGALGMVPSMMVEPAAKQALGAFFRNVESKIK